MKKYKEVLVSEESFTELDLEFPFYDGDDNRNEVKTYNADFSEINVSLKIDELIHCLQNMQKKGADRVYIAQHCDHYGYYITGIKLIEE